MKIRDKGNPPRESVISYTVSVLGENDNRLPYSSTNLVFSVPEISAIGSVVGSVKPEEANFDLTNVW